MCLSPFHCPWHAPALQRRTPVPPGKAHRGASQSRPSQPRAAGGSPETCERVWSSRLPLSRERRRWESNPLRPGCSRLPCRLAPASSPGIEPGLRPPQGRVLVRHTPRTCCLSAPRRGVEPRLAVPKTAVPSVTLAGRILASIPTWTRTRAPPGAARWSWTLGESRAVRYTIGMSSRAGDWTCTSICRFTKPVPHCSATPACRLTGRTRTGTRLGSQPSALPIKLRPTRLSFVSAEGPTLRVGARTRTRKAFSALYVPSLATTAVLR